MKGQYPPGTSRRDLERAGIIETAPECPTCKNTIGTVEDHAEDCEDGDVDREMLEEYHHAEPHPHDRREL